VNHTLRTHPERDLSYEVLSYLAEHPDAQDTLEGIMHWWLLEREIKFWTAEVRGTLAKLVSEGLLVEQTGPDTRTYYRLNRGKKREIQALLEEWKEASES
jgi:DNA-binding PadR family transcriptional regulator